MCLPRNIIQELRETIVLTCTPSFCPNCGANADHLHIIVGTTCRGLDAEYETIVYDCYCKRCHWSGNISPDDALDIPVEVKQ